MLRLSFRNGVLTCIALLSALAGTASASPKVLLIYDMEGVSGVTRYEFARFSHPAEYAVARQSLTDDVNAAVRGLVAGGAGSIWIQDGHASGNDREPDILLDQLDSRAKFDFRDHPFSSTTTGIDGSVDAIVCIGMHARAYTDGFEAHTESFGVNYRVNGVDFSETHEEALSGARFGIPVIMVSGDNVLGEQLKPEFPQMQYAVVKIAKGHMVAVPFPPQEVAQRIETAAKQAMEKFVGGEFRPYYLPPPYTFELTFEDFQQADNAAVFPGVSRVGERSVRYEAATFVEGLEESYVLLKLRNDLAALLVRILNHDPAGKKYLQQLEELRWQRNLDPANFPDWAKPSPAPAREKRFWGDE